MRFNFAFCSKRMETIQTIKTTIIFDVIPLNNANNFFYCKIMPSPFRLASRSFPFGTIKRVTCFSRFELCFET